MAIIAQTERLYLRSWIDGDQKEYALRCNRERVMQHLGGSQTVQELEADVRWFAECEREYGHTLWVVERKSDGAFLGFTGLDKLLLESGEVPECLHGEVEVGWRLRDDVWGRGYASEAARVSLDIAFRVRRLGMVVSRVDSKNAASLRILSKLNFSRNRRLESDDGLQVHTIDRVLWFAHADRSF